MTLQVLVYGSLREGMGNDIRRFAQHANSNMIKKGLARIKGRMFSLGGYPYVSFPEDLKEEETILGEVYEISSNIDDMLKSLDRLEGFPTFYDRKEVETEHGKAWVYFFHRDRPNAPLVNHGDWVKFKTEGVGYA